MFIGRSIIRVLGMTVCKEDKLRKEVVWERFLIVFCLF